MNNFEYLRERLEARAGVYLHFNKPLNYQLDQLLNSEWSTEFENLMRARLVMGALRYGKINAKNKPKYDRINACIKRLQNYKNNLNKELLIDVANLCLLEFVENPNGHFTSQDDTGHVKII